MDAHGSSQASPPSQPSSHPSVLILGGEDTQRLIMAALSELPVRIDRLEDRAEFGRVQRPADLVILERARLDGPGVVEEWLEAGILNPTVPLLLMAAGPVGGQEYREWLAAGVWELVRLPVDPAVLALRLRNILGTRWEGDRTALRPNGPYPWPTLVRATGEVLALGRRHQRPVSALAVAVEQPGEPHPSPRLMYQLGVAARKWVRDSDLVGLTEQDILLLVLPDTAGDDAEILRPRLLAALNRSLKRASTVAALRSATRPAPLDGSESAPEFLLRTVRRVT